MQIVRAGPRQTVTSILSIIAGLPACVAC